MVFLEFLDRFNLKTILLLLLLVSIPFLMFAESITKETKSGYILDISLDNLHIDTVYINNTPYISITSSNSSVSGEEGEPAIPFMSFSTAAPENTNLKLEWLVLQTKIITGIALKPLIIMPHIGSEIDNEIIVNYAKLQYPDKQISIGKKDKIFGVPVISWQYSPVLYDATNNQIKIITKARIKINNPEILKSRFPVNTNLAPKHYGVLKHRIHNYSLVKLSPTTFKSQNVKTSDYDLNYGTWLKIKIDHEGIYKLTYSKAQDAGFPVNDVNLENIKMYGH
ncbi:MAG: hypothetical protein KAR38_11455, partial [Calditrichia bacterium]|nr:hypothetical protein [Calditrichia bacterium]